MKSTRGFTLIELLVVIAIIGILASVVLVSLQSARKKGNDSRVMSSVQQIRVALESNYSANNNYPDLDNAGGPTFFAAVPTSGNLLTLINDIIANQSAGGLTTNVIYGANNANGTWSNSGGSVIITRDAVHPATGYAIYAKLPSGSIFCIDGTGNTKNNATYPVSGLASNVTATNCQ